MRTPPLKIIAAGLFLLLLAFLVLNSFLNFFSLDKISLPQDKLAINCPVPKQFCNQAKPVVFQGKTIGLGFTLPEGTPITAAFPGTLENGIEKNETLKVQIHPLRWLKGSGDFEGYIATYNFFATHVESKNPDETLKLFTQGNTIATASATTFPQDDLYKGVNFIFSLHKGDKFGESVDFRFK